MAMNPMQKKARTSFLLGMFLTLIITGLIIVFLILQLGKIKKEQESIIYAQVYVVTQEILSGGTIIGNISIQEVETTLVPNNAVTLANAATYVTDASTTKIQLEAGTVITTDMINIEGKETTSDERLQEYNMIVLPSQLIAGEFVDIRLRLPSGEDYIVISKKEVKQADATTIWIDVNEVEILTMSNAIVEAYIMDGSLLYATTYVEAGSQDNASVTYIPSSTVLDLMQNDTNVVATAWNALASRVNAYSKPRETINSAVNSYSEDALENIEDNTEEEIEKQQSARQEYIDSLAVY